MQNVCSLHDIISQRQPSMHRASHFQHILQDLRERLEASGHRHRIWFRQRGLRTIGEQSLYSPGEAVADSMIRINGFEMSTDTGHCVRTCGFDRVSGFKPRRCKHRDVPCAIEIGDDTQACTDLAFIFHIQDRGFILILPSSPSWRTIPVDSTTVQVSYLA